MLIWRGKGALVLLAGVLGAFISGVVEGIGFPKTIRFFLMWIVWGLAAAGINYLFCRWFISTKKKTYIDVETGQVMEVVDGSSFFFIRNRTWTYVYLGLFGVLAILQIF
ncbi:hypothetical protein [Lapidilactobacillus bayanensis]|uniref:hypothetical protein n=1 Tax=Lapidilactobacillus bayanensis TaxID=2485998 RepID=UPI000F7778E6|nr:hypothetical protein [Lapidilactobacillus bayanensis]